MHSIVLTRDQTSCVVDWRRSSQSIEVVRAVILKRERFGVCLAGSGGADNFSALRIIGPRASFLYCVDYHCYEMSSVSPSWMMTTTRANKMLKKLSD